MNIPSPDSQNPVSPEQLSEPRRLDSQIEFALAQVYGTYREAVLFEEISSVLHWEAQQSMPPEGLSARGEQRALLSRKNRDLLAHDDLLTCLQFLKENVDQLSADDASNVAAALFDAERMRKFPAKFAAARSAHVTAAGPIWQEAKRASDFSKAQQLLENSVQLAGQEAEFVGYADHPYDALLHRYEPGATLAEIKPQLLEVSIALASLIPRIQAQQIAFGSLPELPALSTERQNALNLRVVADLGFNFNAGRIDAAAHPYMITLGPKDVRLHTRDGNDFLHSLYTAIHEAGHGMYQQGVENYYTPTGQLKSLSLHESQSRFWECVVGKSRAFMEYLHGVLREEVPEASEQLSPELLWRHLNRVEAGPVRVEADEITYGQHILIRMLLEERLLLDQLEASDAPGEWNLLYRQYLGITPSNDALGILQDDHWYAGCIGYFPTYSLGNMYAPQLWDALRRDVPNSENQIADGNFSEILSWLRTNVHRHGSRYSAGELLLRVTDEPASSRAQLEQIKKKFDMID